MFPVITGSQKIPRSGLVSLAIIFILSSRFSQPVLARVVLRNDKTITSISPRVDNSMRCLQAPNLLQGVKKASDLDRKKGIHSLFPRKLPTISLLPHPRTPPHPPINPHKQSTVASSPSPSPSTSVPAPAPAPTSTPTLAPAPAQTTTPAPTPTPSLISTPPSPPPSVSSSSVEGSSSITSNSFAPTTLSSTQSQENPAPTVTLVPSTQSNGNVVPAYEAPPTSQDPPNSILTGGGHTTFSTSNVSPSTSAPESLSKRSPAHLGAIVGGVVGGLMFIFLVGICLYISRRRRKVKSEDWVAAASVPYVFRSAHNSADSVEWDARLDNTAYRAEMNGNGVQAGGHEEDGNFRYGASSGESSLSSTENLEPETETQAERRRAQIMSEIRVALASVRS